MKKIIIISSLVLVATVGISFGVTSYNQHKEEARLEQVKKEMKEYNKGLKSREEAQEKALEAIEQEEKEQEKETQMFTILKQIEELQTTVSNLSGELSIINEEDRLYKEQLEKSGASLGDLFDEMGRSVKSIDLEKDIKEVEKQIETLRQEITNIKNS
ncbi:MAG: hypothetical protein LBT10_06830 [Methanobrevibacter sp.]|jgi:uncharacterized protein HemX|nr:hypothetical protein [Methanobrevibacter sp.]